MTPEEERILQLYIDHRRSMYSVTQFWIIMIPVFVIALVFIGAVIHVLKEAA